MGALGPSRGSWAQGAPSAELDPPYPDSFPWHLPLGAFCAPCGCSLPLSQNGRPLPECVKQPNNHRLFTLFLLRPESLPHPPPSCQVIGIRTIQSRPKIVSHSWEPGQSVSPAATTAYLLRPFECNQGALSTRAGCFFPGLFQVWFLSLAVAPGRES